MARATGLVLTFNGERWLADCLRSLEFCDRLLVVDSESMDRTRQIAEAAGAEVVVRPWPGPADQFRYALGLIDTDWVVSLDQDEMLSPELGQAIREVLAEDDGSGPVGWYCSRRSFYFDRFLKHCGWYPDHLLRFFRAGKMEVKTSGPHYSFHPLGPTGRLAGDIVHYPYAGLREHMDKINYYTQVAADEMRQQGKTSGLAAALGHGLGRFAKVYLVRGGFLDGRAGLILALHAFFYGFHKYIRVAEPAEPKSAPQDQDDLT